MRAILVTRREAEPIDTTELRGLAETAGFEVVDELTQLRSADPTYQVGRGKAEEAAERIAATDVDAAVFGNRITAQQAYHLEELFPPETRVLGRYRLVLEIFAERATDRVAQLEVELAELRYERKRVRAALQLEEDAANERRTLGEFEAAEQGRIKHVDEQIERIEAELAATREVVEQRRERRREAGFDHVAIAGYTNAGKSTLLRRLADDESLEGTGTAGRVSAEDANGAEHDDVTERVTVEDRLFETLETTTRRATIGGRRVLLTDTVGVVSDLPHWLVRSFRSTLRTVETADAVVLVLDASVAADRFEQRLGTAVGTLAERTDAPIQPVLNKVDAVEGGKLSDRRAAVAERFPGWDPVEISAIEGSGCSALRDRIAETLPSERLSLDVPNCHEAMALLSRAYDELDVEDVGYEGDRVEFVASGHPIAAERLRSDAASLREP